MPDRNYHVTAFPDATGLPHGHADGTHRVHEDEVEVVALGEPDERMPVRYGLAKVVVSVAFNTVPSP